MTSFLLPDPFGELSVDDQRRVSEGINQVLKELGRPEEVISGWWNMAAIPELGGLTPVHAWLSGQQEAVRQMVISMHNETLAAAERARTDPEIIELMQRRAAHLS